MKCHSGFSSRKQSQALFVRLFAQFFFKYLRVIACQHTGDTLNLITEVDRFKTILSGVSDCSLKRARAGCGNTEFTVR